MKKSDLHCPGLTLCYLTAVARRLQRTVREDSLDLGAPAHPPHRHFQSASFQNTQPSGILKQWRDAPRPAVPRRRGVVHAEGRLVVEFGYIVVSEIETPNLSVNLV
jgi:hypothetical protein